jgi:hypothetical protein
MAEHNMTDIADIDWRQKLRDFASDTEQHRITHVAWCVDRNTHGITLYSIGDFFAAYYDDAAEMWGQADDTLPMYHVMVQSDLPHRTCIHAMHWAAWVQHLAGMCLPVQILRDPGEE